LPPAGNPRRLLAELTAGPPPTTTLTTCRDRFLASRIDIDANTIRNYRTALKKAFERFGDRDPGSLTVAEIGEWVADLAGDYKPGTVQLYLIALRLLLDHAGVDPNPARDPRVKLPKREREEPHPPSGKRLLAILDAMSGRYRLLFVVIEQGALRLGEAVNLRWADVDVAGSRLRLPRSATKRDRARWVSLPQWLMDAIEDNCPLEDRVPERRVFQGITEASAYQGMTRACRNAKVPHYHTHTTSATDESHCGTRRGVPARELAERAGHARPSMSLDVYSHAMPPDEVAPMKLGQRLGHGRSG